MLKKLSVLVVLGFASMLLPAAAASAHVSSDTYGPSVPTQTHIDIVVGKAGEPIVVDFKVTANDAKKPSGALAIQIGPRGSISPVARAVAPATYKKVVRVSGKRVKVTGPKLTAGRYTVAATFTPDANSIFLPSSDVKDVSVARNDSNPGDDTNDALPNTGGPDLWWLLLGLVLVGSGSAAAVYARRRVSSALVAP